MQVTLDIPEEVAAQAKARGIPVEAYVQSLLEQASPQPTGMAARAMTDEEIKAWFKELKQFSDKIPPMPGETFSREMIYQDHD
jgi:hypothetical protein